jgi:hypothetical protein
MSHHQIIRNTVGMRGMPGSSCFFDLSLFSKRDQWIQLESLRREVAAFYSWVWGDSADLLLVLFDCESSAERAYQFDCASEFGFIGQMGHLPLLPRTVGQPDDSPQTRKWLKDCCGRTRHKAFEYRDRILYECFDVTAYHQSGDRVYPYFEEAGLYARSIDAGLITERLPYHQIKNPDPTPDDDERTAQAFEVFLALLADEGFPVSAYQLSPELFREAENTFRAAVELPHDAEISRISLRNGDDGA